MKHLALDPATHDLLLTNGRASLVEGADEVAQRIRCRILLAQGEAIPDASAGVDYEGRVWGPATPARRVLADAELRRIVAETQGVRRVTEWRSTLDAGARALAITARVEYDDGTTGALSVEGVG